jgi:cytochrome P450
MSTTRRYARFSIHRSLGGTDVNVTSVDTAKALFLKKMQRRYRPLVALVRTGMRHRVMIVADGEEWQRTHDVIAPHLGAGPVARDYAPVINRVANLAFADVAANPGPTEIDVEALMRTISTSVMGFILLGQELPLDEADHVQRILGLCMRSLERRWSAPLNWAVAVVLRILNLPEHQRFIIPRAQRRAIEELVDWVHAKADAARRSGVATPLLDRLYARFAGRSLREQRRAVAAECAMMLIAGIETTAAVLTFAIAEVANDPAVLGALVAEVRNGQPGNCEAEALTAHFPVTYRVIRETMRRHTVVPTMLREAEGEQELVASETKCPIAKVVRIGRGAVLRYFPVQGNLRRSIWGNPHRFDPGRFAQPLTADQRSSYHTFGIGPQSCPGRAIAITEAILVLRSFFRHLDLGYKPLRQEIPVERNALLTVRPVGVTATVQAAG